MERYELEECLEIALASLRAREMDKCQAHVEKAYDQWNIRVEDPRVKGLMEIIESQKQTNLTLINKYRELKENADALLDEVDSLRERNGRLAAEFNYKAMLLDKMKEETK